MQQFSMENLKSKSFYLSKSELFILGNNRCLGKILFKRFFRIFTFEINIKQTTKIKMKISRYVLFQNSILSNDAVNF